MTLPPSVPEDPQLQARLDAIPPVALKLVDLSTCCPEQYNAELDGQVVGYLRLRHGYFAVYCPDAGGELVYSRDTIGDGVFADETERVTELRAAKAAVMAWAGRAVGHQEPGPPTVLPPGVHDWQEYMSGTRCRACGAAKPRGAQPGKPCPGAARRQMA